MYPFKPRLPRISAWASGPALASATRVSLPMQSTYYLSFPDSRSPSSLALRISSSLSLRILIRSSDIFSFSNVSLDYSNIFLALAWSSAISTWALPSISSCYAKAFASALDFPAVFIDSHSA
jgi:hypothetical protein